MTTVLCQRHAHAEEGDYPDDSLRPLSEAGRAVQARVAERLKTLGYLPDIVLHSPFLRAKQSAEIIAAVMDCPLEEHPGLGMEFDNNAMMKYLQRDGMGLTIMLIGHDPSLATFANRLLGVNRFPLGLARSACAVVDLMDAHDYGCASFVELLNPE